MKSFFSKIKSIKIKRMALVVLLLLVLAVGSFFYFRSNSDKSGDVASDTCDEKVAETVVAPTPESADVTTTTTELLSSK